MTAHTINIAGHKINTWVVVAGAGGLVLVFVLYRRSNAASSASTTGASSTDPVTGLPYSMDDQVDPATGMTYLAEAQQYGSVSAAEAAVSTGSTYSAAGGVNSAVGTAGYPTTNVTGSGAATGQSYATNAAWAQAATTELASLGYDPQAISAALGLFFAQHALTADQAQIIQAAEAELGPPPQGTYQIIPAGTTTPPPGGGTTPPPPGGGTTPPPAKHAPATPTGFHTTGVARTSVNLAWKASAGATSYQVRVTYQSQVIKTEMVSGTSASVTGLTPDHTYGLHVVAINSAGWSPEASTTAKTPK